MEHLITTDSAGGRAVLTNEHCASRYGIPVLLVTGDDIDGAFGPADTIGEPPKLFTAASVVAGWAHSPGRTEEQREVADQFLRQWPEGPQLQPRSAGDDAIRQLADTFPHDVPLCELPDSAFATGGVFDAAFKQAGYIESPRAVIGQNNWWPRTVAQLAEALTRDLESQKSEST